MAIALGTFAFLGTFSAQSADQKSRTILDAVSKTYKSNQNTYFKFAYGTGAAGKVTQTQTGIFYTTPTKYKLKIMETEQLFDGSKVYNISEDDKEVTIAKASGSEMMFSPTNYLDTYKSNYNTTYVGKRSLGGVQTDLIKLTPVKKSGIKYVFIYVNAPKNQLVKVEQYSTDNQVAVIAIQDYRANQKLASDFFQFNRQAYQNYLITEL